MITLDATSVVVLFSVRDTSNNIITPSTAKWSLYDEDGLVINNRENVTITPASEMNVVLSPSDLPYELSNNHLILLLEATYVSAYGTLSVAREIEVTVKQRRN